MGAPVGNYGGHSFRIGAASLAAAAGFPARDICSIGHWRSSFVFVFKRDHICPFPESQAYRQAVSLGHRGRPVNL